MVAQGRRYVSRCRLVSHQKDQRKTSNGCRGGDNRQGASAPADQIAAARDGRAQQEREGRVDWHRIVFLRGGKGEEDEHESGPAEGQQAGAAGAVDGLEREPGNRGKIGAPWKQPYQMKRPKVKAGNGVVVARIAQVQETQQLLVDKEKPEKAMILARAAVERE